jgi:hypothetical protein
MTIDDSPDKRGSFLVQSFMTGEQKVLLSFEISEFDREIRKQKARKEHPEWSELEVMHEIIRQAFLPKPMPEWLVRKMQQRLDEQRKHQHPTLE